MVKKSQNRNQKTLQAKQYEQQQKNGIQNIKHKIGETKNLGITVVSCGRWLLIFLYFGLVVVIVVVTLLTMFPLCLS